MFYWGIYLALMVLGALSAGQAGFRRFIFAVVAIFLFCFVAFRYEVGCDWSGYENSYDLSRYWDWSDAFLQKEGAFWALNVLLHRTGLDYPYINLLMAIPFFWGLVAFARREPDPLAVMILSFPVLIINLPMSAIRQAAGLGFICLALLAFQDRRLLRYIVLVVIASLFHSSAAVFLALAPFLKYGISRQAVVAASGLALPGVYLLIADSLETYSERYVGTGTDAAGAAFRSGMLALVGMYFLVSLRSIYRRRFPESYPLVLIGSIIMAVTLPLVAVSTVISDRFGYYVAPIQIMIMARLPLLVEGRNRTLIAMAPYLALGLVLLVWTYYSQLFNQCYVPYRTWLSWQF